MQWRLVKDFMNYEVNEDGDIRHIKKKHIIKISKSGSVNLTKDGMRTNRSAAKIYYDAFPELKDTKSKVKLYATDNSQLIPKTEPERYEVLQKLADKIVSNGHVEFPMNGRILQALWNFQAIKGTNRIVFNGMSYEDLVQEVLLMSYELISTIHEDSPIPTEYLVAAIRNSFLMKYRDKDMLDYATSLDRVGDDGEEYSILDSYEPNRDDIDFGVSDDIQEKLEWLQSKLNKQDYEIIYYYYGHEMTMEEIANIVGLSRQTVSGRIKRIIARVQRLLGKDQ